MFAALTLAALCFKFEGQSHCEGDCNKPVNLYRTIWAADVQCDRRGDGWLWNGERCVAIEGRCPVCGTEGVKVAAAGQWIIPQPIDAAWVVTSSDPLPIYRCPHDGLLFTDATEGR